MKKLLSSLQLTQEQVLGAGGYILTEVYPSYVYENGKRTNKTNGSRLTVVAPSRAYDKFNVRVVKGTDLTNEDLKASKAPVVVRFTDDFAGHIYWKDNGEPGISCIASDFILVEDG